MFHDGVFICEAPADCYFYEATLDGLKDERKISSDSDYVFASSNGKAGIAPLGSALNKLAVPWAAVADIDVIGSKSVIDSIIEVRGAGTPEFRSRLEDLRSGLDTAVRGTGTPPKVATVRDRLSKLLDSPNEHQMTAELRSKITDSLGPEGGWHTIKNSGRSGMKPRDRKRFDDLIPLLAELGLIVVPEGELEGLVDTVDKKGGEWLKDALEAGGHLMEPARSVVQQAIAAITS